MYLIPPKMVAYKMIKKINNLSNLLNKSVYMIPRYIGHSQPLLTQIVTRKG